MKKTSFKQWKKNDMYSYVSKGQQRCLLQFSYFVRGGQRKALSLAILSFFISVLTRVQSADRVFSFYPSISSPCFASKHNMYTRKCYATE